MSGEPNIPNQPSEEAAATRRISDEARAASAVPSGAPAEWRPTLEDVIREQEQPLLRYAARIVRDHAAAQDIVQTALIRLCRHWPALRATPSRIVPWLYRTTHNAAVDYIRGEERHRKATEDMAREAVPGDLTAETVDERRACVEAELNRLSPGEREVLLLRLDAGLSYRQIAEITGRTVGNVGCLLHHAVRRIAAALKARGDL